MVSHLLTMGIPYNRLRVYTKFTNHIKHFPPVPTQMFVILMCISVVYRRLLPF